MHAFLFPVYTPVKQGKKMNESGLGPLTKDNCLSMFHKATWEISHKFEQKETVCVM